MRLEILWALSEDGATARHFKAGLNLGDGVLYANPKKFVAMGYLRSEKVTLEGKERELYAITPEGLLE